MRNPRALLGIATLAIAGGGAAGWISLRSVGGARLANASTVPSPQLSQLAPYAAPVADSQRVVPPVSANVFLARDPFEGRVLAAPTVLQGAAPERPATTNRVAEWRVTTTLMAGSRRAALINDILVYVGDSLPGGSRLTSVERDHVIVTDGRGATHTVMVTKEEQANVRNH